MTLLRKFLRKNPATAGKAAPSHEFRGRVRAKDGDTEALPSQALIHRRADKKRGNCPINETRAYRRVHSILAEGPGNG